MAEAHIPKKTYWIVFAVLMVLLLLTVFIAYMHIDPTLAIIAAMLIAGIKALLVILYFMHVKINSRLVQLVVVTGFGWLIFLIGITLTDYKTRSWEPGYGYQEHVDRYSSPSQIPTSMYPQNLPGAAGAHGGATEGGSDAHEAEETTHDEAGE